MKRSEIECERINTKPHYQNKTCAAALNHVFTCTQCTVYVQYMCINSAALNHVFTCTQCTVYVQYMCINSAALNHVFTCTQCTVYVQYMCINSAAWNKTAKAESRNSNLKSDFQNRKV